MKKAEVKATNDPEKKEWESLYALTQHWQSDLQFYDDELQFLRSLIDKYFIWLVEDENIENTKVLANKLIRMSEKCTQLESRTREHSKHIASLMENPFPYNKQDFKDEHLYLENSLPQFLKDFRQIKREVFRLTTKIIESEKAKHLLSR